MDVERASVVCRECCAPMNVLAEGEWVAEAPGNERIHGYHLNRLYVPWVNLRDMIERSQATTPAELQEFFNSDLGEPFLAPHGSFSLDEFDRLRADYKVGDYRGQPCVMDVDPGTELHVVVRERLGETGDRSRLWFAGTVGSFEELDGLFKRYHVHTAVIDAQPEQHAARQFAESHPGTFVSYLRLLHPDRGRPRVRPLHGGRPRQPHAAPRPVARPHAQRRAADPRAGAHHRWSRQGPLRWLLHPAARAQTRAHAGCERELGCALGENNKPDHYAHAEGYCLLALERAGRPGSGVRFFVQGQREYPPGMQPSSYSQVIADTWYR